MDKVDLTALARLGAEARLAQLDAEIAAIRRAFPDLAGASPSAISEARPKPARRTMSLAERRQVSLRMKALWARRRAEKQQASAGTPKSEAADKPATRPKAARRGRKPRPRKPGKKA
jgi:hypothetical protein